MTIPTAVIFEQEWNVEREALLVEEKALTRARDVLAAKRRRLPLVRVDKNYGFEGPRGEASLLDLFEGRRQLIVYTTGRAAEGLGTVWGLLGITPLGRQEDWQDAPAGVPQDRTGSWTRRHDEYSPEALAGGRRA
jgi:predicted dithiol-disulfide oxidoreductase (DUF899 family)